MDRFTLRKAAAEHDHVLAQIGRKTFKQAFADSDTAEHLDLYLSEKFTQEQLAIELAHPESVFYLAEDRGWIGGYIKLNTGSAQTDLQEPDAMEIERIYILESHYGKNLGGILLDQAVAAAKSQQKTSIWLLVQEKNARAMRFLKRHGFIAFGTYPFTMGNEPLTNILMRKLL